MKAYTRRRLAASLKLGLAFAPLVVVLRLITGSGLVVGSILLGFTGGLAVGVVELFLLRNWLKGLPFLAHLIVKSLALMAVIYVAFSVLNVLDVIIDGITWRAYFQVLVAPSTLLGLFQGFVLVALLLFFVQLDRLLGPGVLLGFMTGRYHRPRHESRIFMFLDLKGSTALADSMDPDRYFHFLHRYFAAMSEPILETNANVYQYVGDEVVLTWKMKAGLEEAGCIRAFFLIEDEIENRTPEFLSEFGAVPEFKAAVHAGDVIAAQIGELKSEVVYNGDVLNTTARLEALCNPLGHRLLVTQQLVRQMTLGPDLELLDLGPVQLRGKGGATAICAVQRAAAPAAQQH